MNILIILCGIIIGFYIAKLFAGNKEGEEKEIHSIQFNIGKYHIHLHHWISATIILIILLIIGFYHDLVYGFLFGLIIQGLTYKDFYEIVFPRGIKH